MKIKVMRNAFGKKQFKIMPMTKANGWLVVIDLFGLGIMLYK